MLLTFEDRPSTSPYVERIWRSRSYGGGQFLSMAECHLELIVTRLPGSIAVLLRGPVTQARFVDCPPEGEWLGIRFRPGTYLPRLPTAILLDHQNLDLPVIRDKSFWFSGLIWEIPDFDNAEDLVARLAGAGLIARDCSVDAVIAGDEAWMSQRSVQRHFLRATGVTIGGFQKVARARQAASLLTQGYSILDASFEAGYFDQAHMTRSVKQLIGMTPAKLVSEQPQLSFSYKTEGS